LGHYVFPIGLGFRIIILSWWIGIGHADLFPPFSRSCAKLGNFHHRFAEPCVVRSGLRRHLPLIHTGRRGRYWMFLTESIECWRISSPLIWDVFAVSSTARYRWCSGSSDCSDLALRARARADHARHLSAFWPWVGAVPRPPLARYDVSLAAGQDSDAAGVPCTTVVS